MASTVYTCSALTVRASGLVLPRLQHRVTHTHSHARTHARTHTHTHTRYTNGTGKASEQCQLQVSASKRRGDINRHFLPFCVSSLASLRYSTCTYIGLPHKLLQVRMLRGELPAGRLATEECLAENRRREKEGEREEGERRVINRFNKLYI